MPFLLVICILGVNVSAHFYSLSDVVAAVKSKNGEITALLLAKGADINLINNKGEDVAHLANGDALQAVRAFKEGDMPALKKRFPIVQPFGIYSRLEVKLNVAQIRRGTRR